MASGAAEGAAMFYGGTVMSNAFTICVGTIGSGIWRSPDGGETWSRIRPSRYPENDVRALAVHPRDPHIVYAGTDSGVYRSDDRGARWERLDAPMNTMHTWALAIDPAEPETLFAGTQPSAVFRSQDGGQQWDKLALDLADECPAVVIPRVTALAVDPEDHRTVWAGIEVDGVRRSVDGGETWTTIAGGLDDPDIHGIAISGGQPKVVLATTPREVFASTDAGESWQRLEVMQQFPYSYTRAIAVKADDPHVIFVGHGQTASPTIRSVQRSQDGGKTWETLPLPGEPNSYISCLATHSSDPTLVLASTLYGQLFMSTDAGDSGRKVRQEFSEVRSLAWLPS
jgi:photosystem II stability/assembly factor-like uncharacterized protein